jgi:hypothetical protein
MITKKNFTEQVEKLIVRGRGCDVMSAIIKVCETNSLEPESAKRLLSNPLKEKLEAEAQKLNLINRGQVSQANITKFYED